MHSFSTQKSLPKVAHRIIFVSFLLAADFQPSLGGIYNICIGLIDYRLFQPSLGRAGAISFLCSISFKQSVQ